MLCLFCAALTSLKNSKVLRNSVPFDTASLYTSRSSTFSECLCMVSPTRLPLMTKLVVSLTFLVKVPPQCRISHSRSIVFMCEDTPMRANSLPASECSMCAMAESLKSAVFLSTIVASTCSMCRVSTGIFLV